MTIDHNMFASKLNELNAEYAQMIRKLKHCCKGTIEDIHRAGEELLKDCLAQESGLQDVISSGRSQAITELSKLQLQYFQEIRAAATEKIPQYLNDMSDLTGTSRAEATALYAEFAIDNAVQAMRYALHAMLFAVELQMKADQPRPC